MIRLYFDTETTGFPRKSDAPIETQPHIVQLAALLVDDDEGEIASMNVIIRPMGWTIPDEVAAIHGITQEKAERFGVRIERAIGVFYDMCNAANQAVAHNIVFDAKLAAIEFERTGLTDRLNLLPQFCTMLATTDLCKIPGKFGRNYKWPKLIEAHQYFFGCGFEGEHDALADVRACARIHRAILDEEKMDATVAEVLPTYDADESVI
jgi:DNA polymerase III epsilon subunit-like protein